MRIAIVAPRSAAADPPFEGSLEGTLEGSAEGTAVALAQGRALARAGHRVRVVLFGELGQERGSPQERGLPELVTVPSDRGEGEDSFPMQTLAGAEIVHGHLPLPAAVAIARESTAPLVLTAHEPGVTGPELGPALSAAARVVVPSRTHLVRLAQQHDFPPGRVRILEPGHGLQLPARRRRPRPWGGGGALRVLHLGERSEAAGTLDLVRALTGLPAGSVELSCVGKGSPGFDRRLAVEAGDLPLELAPPADGAALVRLAARCHLAALPSRRPESYALPVDEALALGLPVWAANGEAARERFEPPALELLPAGDPAAWTRALAGRLAEPASWREAFEALPEAVPTAAAAADGLERIYGQITPPSLERVPPRPRHRRPA